MKRLIKYWNMYERDGANFSDCSTKYEILPELVKDDAGSNELLALAKKYKIKNNLKVVVLEQGRRLSVTHAVKVRETKPGSGMYASDPGRTHQVYLGFITIPDGSLEPIASLDNKVTPKMANNIVNNQEYGVADYGETVDHKMVLVKSGWDYYHAIKLAGYSLESFEKVLDITDHGFEDDTSRCSRCYLYDSNDSGYTNNFRIMDYEILGINCGCYAEFCESDEALDMYADNADQAMELDAAEKHEKAGRLKFLERFIGGMTDGRGGSYGGKRTREGDPDSVYKEYRKKYPQKRFLFTHDESGQFQTYFSIWEIRPKTRKATKAKAAKGRK